MNKIDKALAKNLDKEGLLKLATVDRLIELYRDRPLVNVDEFCKSYDKLYNILKDERED
jgi:hypothetical protein